MASKKSHYQKIAKNRCTKNGRLGRGNVDIYRMEKLTFLARLKTDVFKDYWENCVDFVSQGRVDFLQ